MFANIILLCAAVLAVACVSVAKRAHLVWLHDKFMALSWFHKVVVRETNIGKTDGDHEGHDHLTSETCFTVVELRNEPITTMAKTVDGRRHIVNPCCAVIGAESHFAVDMLPHDIPNESIVWRCSGGQLSFSNNGTGREMTVVASAGDGSPVEIEIDHIAGLPNKMHFNIERWK